MYDHVQVRQELEARYGLNYPHQMRPKGKIIGDLRESRGLSQEELGSFVAKGQTWISNVENGKVATLSTEYLYVWSKHLGCLKLTDIAEYITIPETAEPLFEISDKALQDIAALDLTRTLVHPVAKVSEIYHPLRLVATHQQTSVSVQSLDGLPSRAIIVMGTAGQGKSLFLRSLALQEASQQRSLPMFVELRRLGSERLRDYLGRRFQEWELCDRVDQVDHLINQRKVSILLDAFDELAIPYRQALVEDLEQIHRQHPHVTMVMTSRPQAAGSLSPWLTGYRIATLLREDVEALLRIYARPESIEFQLAQTDDILKLLQGLLLTPIFVVLLVIHFEHTKQLPKTQAGFYSGLIDSLIRRHNQQDGADKLPLKSRMSAPELEVIFGKLSFLAHKKYGSRPIPHPELIQLAFHAMKTSEGQPDLKLVEAVTEDILNLTHLIYEEGGFCYYIHNTVREYFAAAHLASHITPEQNRVFYTDCVKKWHGWDRVLQFLEELDADRCRQYFLSPDLDQCGTFEVPQLCRTMNQVSFRWVAESVLAITMFNSKSFLLAQRQLQLTAKFEASFFIEVVTALNPVYAADLQQSLEAAKENPKVQCGVLLTPANRAMTDVFYSERFLALFASGIDLAWVEKQIADLRVLYIRTMKAIKRAADIDHDYRL